MATDASSSNAAQQVGEVYDRVMDDVLENVRQSFRDEGLDESVLNDLRLLWMDKLARHGQVTGTSVVPQAPPQAAADGTAAGASTAGGKAAYNFYPHNKGQPTGEAAAATNSANAAGSGASRVEQTDGAFGNHAAYAALERLTQLDGGTNDKAEGGAAKADPHDDEELTDSSDEDVPDEKEEENFIICQYEKVARQKNKYKVQLKQGIMQLNGTEYMFHKADGQFTW